MPGGENSDIGKNLLSKKTCASPTEGIEPMSSFERQILGRVAEDCSLRMMKAEGGREKTPRLVPLKLHRENLQNWAHGGFR